MNDSPGSPATRRHGARVKLFISYRRRSDTHLARLLKDGLTEAFGEGSVFRDVDDIAPGDAFPESIGRAVESCDVFIPVISPGWMESLERLSDPADFARREIAAALARKIPVLPVLVGGARMPTPDELPEELRDLAFRQALGLSDERWDYDVTRLVGRIRERAPAPPPDTAERRGGAALRGLFGSRPGKALIVAAAVAALCAAAAGVLKLAVWNERYRSFEACVGFDAPDVLGGAARVEAGAYDVPVVSADAYHRVLESKGRPDGVGLVVTLTDSGKEVGAVVLRYFKDGEVFKVERVVEPGCAAVEQYVNQDREGGDKRVLQNWDTLRARLGGRDYYLRVGDQGDRVLATLTSEPRK